MVGEISQRAGPIIEGSPDDHHPGATGAGGQFAGARLSGQKFLV
jgi:hypothetical protein